MERLTFAAPWMIYQVLNRALLIVPPVHQKMRQGEIH